MLNEADQLLAGRSESLQSSVDKMHNQMQNIFLEQFEQFEGILVATTNFIHIIDEAFSRRFDFKIELKRPTFDQRLKIWEKLLPKNAPMEAIDNHKLAEFDLSGGQIQLVIKNCAYKVAIDKKGIFTMRTFLEEIDKELKGNFGEAVKMGF